MDADADTDWRALLAGRIEDAGALAPLYAPLLVPSPAGDGSFVLGRIAQSLDGRIATMNGASRWISGHEDIVHTHRLRALFDAIVIGAGTVAADDPQLTTREVEGPSPVRVVIDTERRLDHRYRLFREGPPTLLVCAEDAAAGERIGQAEILRVPRAGGRCDPAAVVAALAARGLRRVFVEGGGITVSRFLAAGLLDRLHVTVAPLLLGSGIPSFALTEAAEPAEGLRVSWRVFPLGADLLLDIPIGRTRPACCA